MPALGESNAQIVNERLQIEEIGEVSGGRCSRCGGLHNFALCQVRDPWDYVAPFFGSSDFDQGFYSIPAEEGEVRPQEVLHHASLKIVT